MVKVELFDNPSYLYCFKMTAENGEYYGGITKTFELNVSPDCPYKEMMLRVLINKCMNAYISEVSSKDIWETDLKKFGFKEKNGIFVCGFYNYKLPHDCKH